MKIYDFCFSNETTWMSVAAIELSDEKMKNKLSDSAYFDDYLLW